MKSEKLGQISFYLISFGWFVFWFLWVIFPYFDPYMSWQSVEPVILCDSCYNSRISMTPDGEKILSAKGHLHLFDNQGNELWVVKGIGTERAFISDDGSFITAESFGGELWNGFLIALDSDGKILWERETGMIDLESIAITPDGSFIAVGSTDKETGKKGFLSLFTRDGERLWLYEFPRRVEGVAIGNKGDYVLAGIRNNYVYLFDKNGNLLWSFFTNIVLEGNEFAFFPDGNHFIIPTGVFQSSMFDVDGNEIWTRQIGYLSGVAISPEGSCFATDISVALRNKLYLFDRDGNKLWEKGILLMDIYAMDVSENCEYVVVGAKKGITEPYAVVVFDREGNWLWDYEAEETVYSVAISRDGKYVVMGGGSQKLRLFDNFKAMKDYERRVPVLKTLGTFLIISSMILLIWDYLDKRSKKKKIGSDK